MTQIVKITKILELKSKEIPSNYISYAWSTVSYNLSNIIEAQLIMSKSWLAGFTEAEGSLYIIAKTPTRLVHAFGITQKLDLIVLNAIRLIIGVSTPYSCESKQNSLFFRYN